MNLSGDSPAAAVAADAADADQPAARGGALQ
jgi:hypothetical protein